MTALPNLRLNHMGVFVRDLDRMVAFYRDVLGFVITDRGTARGFRVTFMTRDPTAHHQIVLSDGRPETSGPTHAVQQISFKVDALDDLRAMHKVIAKRDDVSEVLTVDHGNAWSLYFRDPEENRIEIYLDSPWHVAQPHRVDLDLTLSDKEIHKRTEARVREDATWKPMEVWQQELEAKLRAAWAR